MTYARRPPSHLFFRICRALAVLPLLVSAAFCSRHELEPSVGRLAVADLALYRAAISDSDQIFVGALLSFDTDWTGYSGFMAVCTSLQFEPKVALAGALPSAPVTAEQHMVGKGLWVEERPSAGGLRLDPAFFSTGRRFVVLLSTKHQFCGHPAVLFILPATPENLAAIRADLRLRATPAA